MDKFLAAQTITRTVSLVDNAGNALTATAATYRVLDQDGTVLVASAVVPGFGSGNPTAVIPVSSGVNTLGAGITRALRSIELILTLAGGQVVMEDHYIIESLNPMIVPTESLQSLGSAELVAMTIPNLTGWAVASRDDKVASLMQARRNIVGMSYRRIWANRQNRIEYEVGEGVTMGIDVLYLFLLTPVEFDQLDPDFKIALNRAQVIEADDLLGGDPLMKKRTQGVVMEKIGETTVMFRQGKVSRKPLCFHAMRALAMYIDNTISIGRA